MNLKFFSASAILVSALFLLSNTRREPNNPPTGKTGAPGETTCADAGCHSGGNYAGTVSISGIPDTVAFNTTYSITLTNTSNAVRAGFELTCLDSSNAMCGSLVAGAGCSIGSGSAGRKYARQSSPKLLSNGSASWTFTWKSPASASNNAATFYFISLCANNNNQKTGDNPILANKSVVFKTLTPVVEPAKEAQVKIYPTIITGGVLNIELLDASQGKLIILDTQGKQVFESTLLSSNNLNISNLSKGVYVVNIFADGKTAVKKMIVE